MHSPHPQRRSRLRRKLKQTQVGTVDASSEALICFAYTVLATMPLSVCRHGRHVNCVLNAAV
jgi:hypothetical protein